MDMSAAPASVDAVVVAVIGKAGCINAANTQKTESTSG